MNVHNRSTIERLSKDYAETRIDHFELSFSLKSSTEEERLTRPDVPLKKTVFNYFLITILSL